MAGEHCCGRLVGLFDPSQCAPGEAALAGCAIGYRGRSRACHCDESGGRMMQVFYAMLGPNVLNIPKDSRLWLS